MGESPAGDEAAGLTLAEAADRLGVHYMTAYRYVRLGKLPATKIGGAWTVELEAIEQFADQQPAQPLDTSEATNRLIDSLVAGDEDQAWDIIEPFLGGDAHTVDVQLDLLAPAMVTIGDQWASGDLSVVDEHRATVIASRLIGRARPYRSSPGRRRGIVAIGAPRSDTHSLATAIFAEVVRDAGPNVIDLGGQTPVSTFVQVARRHGGALCVCITVSSVASLGDVTPITAALREEFEALPILVGGGAIDSAELASSLGSTAWEEDPAEAARLAARLASNVAAA